MIRYCEVQRDSRREFEAAQRKVAALPCTESGVRQVTVTAPGRLPMKVWVCAFHGRQIEAEQAFAPAAAAHLSTVPELAADTPVRRPRRPHLTEVPSMSTVTPPPSPPAATVPAEPAPAPTPAEPSGLPSGRCNWIEVGESEPCSRPSTTRNAKWCNAHIQRVTVLGRRPSDPTLNPAELAAAWAERSKELSPARKAQIEQMRQRAAEKRAEQAQDAAKIAVEVGEAAAQNVIVSFEPASSAWPEINHGPDPALFVGVDPAEPGVDRAAATVIVSEPCPSCGSSGLAAAAAEYVRMSERAERAEAELTTLRAEHEDLAKVRDAVVREFSNVRPAWESAVRLAGWMSTHRDLLDPCGACDDLPGTLSGDGAIVVLEAQANQLATLRAEREDLLRERAELVDLRKDIARLTDTSMALPEAATLDADLRPLLVELRKGIAARRESALHVPGLWGALGLQDAEWTWATLLEEARKIAERARLAPCTPELRELDEEELLRRAALLRQARELEADAAQLRSAALTPSVRPSTSSPES